MEFDHSAFSKFGGISGIHNPFTKTTAKTRLSLLLDK